MGALDEGHCYEELENGLKLGDLELNGGEGRETETVQIENAVRVLLQGLGEDVNREGLRKTPLRVAKALKEGTAGYDMKVKDMVQGALFPESGLNCKVGQAGGAGGLVIVRDLDLYSYCESCLLPFHVKCHVGYVPSGGRVVGLSKLSRVSDVFAKRLQDPQRLANDICSALQQCINPAGVAVLIQCSHIQVPSLESIFLNSSAISGSVEALVSSGAGILENKKGNSWSDFLNLLRLNKSTVNKIQTENSIHEHWCPSQALSTGAVNPAMVNAAYSILRALGEDPSREELLGTPTRFVKWLMNFKNAKPDMKLNGFASSTKFKHLVPNGDFDFSKTMHSELNLPFWSQCEHHLLPFHGVVHIGYFFHGDEGSADLPIRRTILQSIVHFYGLKLQVQERITRQVAETIAPLLGGDVMVVVEANHTCMISRGIQKFGSSTATIAVLGRFSTDSETRALFLESISSAASISG